MVKLFLFLLLCFVASLHARVTFCDEYQGGPGVGPGRTLVGTRTLNRAVAEIGDAKMILVVTSPISPLTGNLTVPANVTLEFAGDGDEYGLISCGTFTATIQSSTANWPSRQIFASDCSSTGTVILGKGNAPVVFPDWWEDDPTVDRTTAIQAAIKAPPHVNNNLADLGATQIRLSNAVYKINNELIIPGGTDLVGGGRGSIIQATASTAMINYVGSGETNGPGIHGKNGNFTFDGDNIAATAVRIGITTLTLADVYIGETTTSGIRLEGTQNSLFSNLFINFVGDTSGNGTSLVIDGASAGNTFLKCEFNEAGRSHILQTKTLDGNGAAIGSFNNAFYDCILERYRLDANAVAAVELNAGSIHFFHSQLLAPDASGKSAVRMRSVTYNSTVFDPAGSTFTDCDFTGIGGTGVGQIGFDSDVTTFSNFVVKGNTQFSGLTTVFSLDDQSNATLYGRIIASPILNWFTNNGGGSSVATARVLQTVDARLLENISIPSGYTNNVWQGFEGATNRFALTGHGRLNVTRYRATLGTALVAGDFALSGGWGNAASVGTITGNDQRMQFTVTSGGTGQGVSPTITLTYKDGTWATAPFVQVVRNGGTGTGITGFTWSTTATILTITAVGTPVTGETYVFTINVMG